MQSLASLAIIFAAIAVKDLTAKFATQAQRPQSRTVSVSKHMTDPPPKSRLA
jgi:hypothetical protein